ncbi:unnamed protein product, partial [Amoebophrya sp. A25]
MPHRSDDSSESGSDSASEGGNPLNGGGGGSTTTTSVAGDLHLASERLLQSGVASSVDPHNG